MAILSTGPIENSPVLGIRPTQQVTVKILNRDAVNGSSVVIQGYVLGTTRTIYVSEGIIVAPNTVITKHYFADLDALEFLFAIGGAAENEVEVSVWGKQASGQLVSSFRVVAQENLG
ncbi:hypothetical protein [Paenibacillus wynnii]|uniref:Uncharacterized protein n=1 Tax=Paenibacillus wynnii TaxID=268407 RepID=A0A098MA00_9BACL|nr:hypothetical protein [Paenibacillus wynnii]KGE18362.1 hypothetical protein PWYN_28030 [Paenibacillus wynnii]